MDLTAKAKIINAFSYKFKGKIVHLLWAAVRYILLFGLSFIIIYPFLVKFSSVFMGPQDLADKTVRFVSRNPTLMNLKNVIEYTGYFNALKNTFLLSLLTAVLQTFCCTLIGYGFAKFKFRGNNIVFILVVFTMIIPPQTLSIPYYMLFKNFNLYGLIPLISGHSIRLLDTLLPFSILSITGLGFKNGLYIFLVRQFFRGVPEELSEAAEVDGASVFKTYFRIQLPQAVPIMITVFLFSFSWQWTDINYSNLFFINFQVLNKVVENAGTLMIGGHSAASGSMQSSVLLNTASFLVIIPLVIVYVFAQKKFVQGVESSGIVG